MRRVVTRLFTTVTLTLGLMGTAFAVTTAFTTTSAGAQPCVATGSYSTTCAPPATDGPCAANGVSTAAEVNALPEGCLPTSAGTCATPARSSSAQASQAANNCEPAAVSKAVSTSSGGLAFTGADVTGTVAIGIVLIGAGLLVVRMSRRRQRLT